MYPGQQSMLTVSTFICKTHLLSDASSFLALALAVEGVPDSSRDRQAVATVAMLDDGQVQGVRVQAEDKSNQGPARREAKGRRL